MLSNREKPAKWLELLFVFGLILAIILPRGLDLSRYVTIDEGLWLYRSANYYYAVWQHEYQYTHQTEHPGVTTMMAGAVGYHFEFPMYKALAKGYMDGGKKLVKFLDTTDKTPIDLLVAGRKVMILVATFLLVASYWLVRKLIGFIPAILGFFLIALERVFGSIVHIVKILTNIHIM